MISGVSFPIRLGSLHLLSISGRLPRVKNEDLTEVISAQMKIRGPSLSPRE